MNTFYFLVGSMLLYLVQFLKNLLFMFYNFKYSFSYLNLQILILLTTKLYIVVCKIWIWPSVVLDIWLFGWSIFLWNDSEILSNISSISCAMKYLSIKLFVMFPNYPLIICRISKKDTFLVLIIGHCIFPLFILMNLDLELHVL
jgi:hypothetical protein